MAVIFNATIKMADDENWCIELVDTVDNRVEICNSVEEFSKKVEELGQDYGGHVDEVKWFKDEDVLPHIMDELRLEMAKAQEELEKNKEDVVS